MGIGLLVTLVFLLSSGAVIGVYLMIAGRSQASLRKTVEHRLQEVSGGAAADQRGDIESLIREQATGPMPSLDDVAKRAVGGMDLERWLAQSGLGLSISGLLLISLVAGVAVAAGAVLASHLLWAALPAFALGAALPFMFVRYKRGARLRKFEEHFPEALDLMSRAIRAGHAFGAGMKMVADELGEPVGPEFRKAFEEQNFGLSMKESLNNLADRMPLIDVRFFVTAVLIQRETGGNLSEILDNLANVVRERFKIQRQVRVHTAHGRFTGYVLLALPGFLSLALSFINPEHMELLFKDPMGQMMIAVSIAMQVVGWLWIKRVIKIEV
jgi:tight adherence protein B